MAGRQEISHNTASGNSRNHYGNVYNYASSPAPTPANSQNSSSPGTLPASSAQNARPSSLDDFQIAIICALKREYDAVDALMEEVWEREEAFRPRRPDNNTYTFGRLGGKPVALVNLPSMGEISAAGVASHLKISLPNIEIAFLVGLCAGAPDDGEGNVISMADVIIGTQVIQEDYGRLRDEGFERKTDVEDVLGRLPPRVRGWLVQRSGRRHRKELRQYTEAVLADAFKDSETASDFAFPGRVADESFPSSRKLQIFFGRIESSNSTLRSQARRDEMIKQDGILGFEMESAGIWDQLPTVVVKAVCDYGDSQKSKEWQDFAALTAAACTKALVREWILHVQDRISGGQLTTASPSRLGLALDSSNEHRKGRDEASANHPERVSAKCHESPGQDADEASAMNDAFWSFVSLAWIYTFLNMLLGPPSITSAVSTAAHNTEQASSPSTIRDQIEDAISGLKKVVSIFGDAAETFNNGGNTCSRLHVELFIVADWLDENIAGIEDREESTLSHDVQSVLGAIEKAIQDQPHESHHRYPKLRVLALCGNQSRSYNTEKARVLSRLRGLLQTESTALKDLELQVSSFTKSKGITPTSAEATTQPVRSKPAGYSSVVKSAIHRILNQSMRCCTCAHASSQGSSHLLQILLEPIATATPGTTPRFELLISSKPTELLRTLGQNRETLAGHWKDVFITYSPATAASSKQVRWADQDDMPKGEPEFTKEIKQSDHPLCGIIPEGSMHQRWGVQIIGNQLFRTGKPLPLLKKVQPYHGVTLGSILGLLTDKTRACLAYILAQSLWQFYDCDLTGIRWSCDSIELMWYNEGPRAGDPRLFSSMPYLAYRSTSHDAYVQECLHGESECYAIHGYPRVVALGILLLEIGMGKKFELPECSIEHPDLGPTEDEIWDYAQEQAKCPWPNLNFPNYWRSVQNCFDVHLFDLASPNPDATMPEKELELSKRRDILYDQVVMPLEQLVYGTGWVDGLRSKDHVTLPFCSIEADHTASTASVPVIA